MSRSLKVLFLYNGIFVFAGSLLGPLYALYVGTFDDKILSVSISWFVYLASSVIFTYFVARIGDSIKETEYLLITGFFLRGLAWLMMINTQSLAPLVLIQILMGMGEAAGTPAFDAIVARHLDKGHQIRDYSDWKIISNITGAVGVLVGGIIVMQFGFTYLFVIMSVLAFGVSVLTLLQPRKLL